MAEHDILNLDQDYVQKYGFYDSIEPVFQTERGLTRRVVEEISYQKSEPKWMRDFRLQAYEIFMAKPMPTWGPDLSRLNFDEIVYYIKPTERQGRTWDEVPEDIKRTFDRLGIPEWERKFLAGVGAQYDCLTADTVVFAEASAVPIAEIQPGQYVYSLDPETRRIIKQRVRGVMYKGKLPVFEVKVAGRTIKATYNHPFLAVVYQKEEGRHRGKFSVEWRYLSDLQTGDYIAIAKQLPDDGIPYRLPEIPLTKTYKGRNQFGEFTVQTDRLHTRQQTTLRIPEYSSEPLMWLIGAYLGDGYLRNKRKNAPKTIVEFAFPQSDDQGRARLAEAFQEVFGYTVRFEKDPYRVRIHSAPIARLFEALGLDAHAKTKNLPRWVFSLPRSQKLALIAGYIDADGTVRCSEKHNDILLTSVNRTLLEDIHRLALSCGLRVTHIWDLQSQMTYKGLTVQRTYHRLMITGDFEALVPYSVKVARGWLPRQYYQRYNSYRNGSPLDAYTSEHIGFAPIESITYLGVEDTYDIEVEGVHNFIAEGIVVHNSEVVYHSLAKQWEEKGVIFVDTDTAVREYPDIVQEYFGTVIPPNDNKFAALNSAVWSGGSFVYVPAGVHVDIPLQAYFRINAKNAGQFERTLIIAEEGAFVHYVEGCTAPVYAEEALHSAVVEIIVKPGARVRYTTIQNWSRDVYNLVTKRAVAYRDAVMEWVDGNIGSRVTQKYPSVYLMEPGARGEILSVAFAGDGQHQDTGGKVIHAAPYTSSRITSKSISKGTGRASYRGLVQVLEGAHHSKCNVECDALLLDEDAKTDTYPYIEINEKEVTIGHEARVSKVSEEQLFYLQSRGLKKDEALTLIVSGFIEPLAKSLPMEYAVELNRLIELEMEGSVG